MSARPSEAKPEPGEASRLTQVLQAGVVHAGKKARDEKRNHLEGLLPDVANKIIGLVKSPLQTCEIVRIVHNQGWYEYATPAQLLHLIKLLFFEHDIVINSAGSKAETLAAALAHVQQVLADNFGDEADATTTKGLKSVLRRLCEGYSRALTAIRAMEHVQPWERGFEWGTGSDGLSIEIPFKAVVRHKDTQSTIDAFIPLGHASALTGWYRRLLAVEEEEKEDLKAQARSRVPRPLRKPWKGVPPHVQVRPSARYFGTYYAWLGRRKRVEELLLAEPSVNSLPRELQTSEWRPLYDKRACLDNVVMFVNIDERRITEYHFFVRDPREEQGGWYPPLLGSIERMDGEAGVV